MRRLTMVTALYGTLGILGVVWVCRPDGPGQGPIYGRFEPPEAGSESDSTRLYAVVEIPAGTAVVMAVDEDGSFREVAPNPVDFLPFPGNYGFVAGCARMDSLSDIPDPLPVLIMMPAYRSGSMIAIRPIATLMLTRDTEPYPIIIAVPEDPSLGSIQARSFIDFITRYDAARAILQSWFLNYLGRGTFELAGWKDESYARRLIEEWKITQ